MTSSSYLHEISKVRDLYIRTR